MDVIHCKKHVVDMYSDLSDEMSRGVLQAEDGRVLFERCP